MKNSLRLLVGGFAAAMMVQTLYYSKWATSTALFIEKDNINNRGLLVNEDNGTTVQLEQEILTQKQEIASLTLQLVALRKEESESIASMKSQILALEKHQKALQKEQAEPVREITSDHKDDIALLKAQLKDLQGQLLLQRQPQQALPIQDVAVVTPRQKAPKDKKKHKTDSMNAAKDLYLPLTSPNLWDKEDLLPGWLKSYFLWHQQQIALLNESNWHDFKFLIQVAPKGAKSGGMTDRLRTLPAMLRVASQTKRILMIKWGRPFPLEEFLLPPEGGLDWRVPECMFTDVNRKRPKTALDMTQKAAATNDTVVTVQYQSWNYGELWYKENAQEGEPSIQQVFRHIWRITFTPAPPVAHRIQANLDRMNLVPGEFATAHIRALYAIKDRKAEEIEKIARNAMNCVSNLRPGGPFFVASDSSLAVQRAVAYGRAHNVTVVAANHSGQPLHIDFHNESDTSVTPADFYDGFVDFYLIGATRCAAIGRGGFAQWGRLMGYNDTCVIHHHGRKSRRRCNWLDGVDQGEAVPGYPSEEERIQLQLEAAHTSGALKYYMPKLETESSAAQAIPGLSEQA